MTDAIESRLIELGITLPETSAAVANYLPVARTGDLLFVSGQLPMADGRMAWTGRLGEALDIDQGRQAARLCAINMLAQLRAALDGELDRVARVVRLGGFVASAEDFTAQPQVINGASDLMVDVFGEAGRHARAAVGVNVLPLGAAVELEGLFEAP
ncbi:MAG: RidA family protein [Alphaproteobacteria bacterium]|nr:MAG: RidA family protein [Alphaproteobacteria bacterium]